VGVDVVSAVGGTQAAGTSLAINFPNGFVRDHIYVVVVCNNNANQTAPAGWTIEVNPATGRAAWWYQGTGDPTNVTHTWTWTGNWPQAYMVIELSGAAIGQGVDASGGSASTSAAPLAPSVTPHYVTDLLLCVYYGVSGNAITVPGSMSQVNVTPATGNGITITAGYETLTSNAATGTRAASCTSQAWVAFSMCFAPLSPAGPNTLSAAPLANVVGAIASAPVACIGLGSASNPSKAPPFTSHGNWAGCATNMGQTSPEPGLAGGYHGNFKVTGIVYDGVNVAQRRVFLTPRNAQGLVLAEQFSDPTTGVYLFENVAAGLYDVWGVDQNDVQNDAWQAMVAAVRM